MSDVSHHILLADPSPFVLRHFRIDDVVDGVALFVPEAILKRKDPHRDVRVSLSIPARYRLSNNIFRFTCTAELSMGGLRLSGLHTEAFPGCGTLEMILHLPGGTTLGALSGTRPHVSQDSLNFQAGLPFIELTARQEGRLLLVFHTQAPATRLPLSTLV